MKKALAFFLVTIIIVSLMPSTIANTADYSMVGVILSQNADTFSIKADGTYFLKENSSSFTDGTLTVTRSSSSLLTVTHSEKGILYTGKSVSIMRENIDTDAGSLALGNFKYLGHFLISIVDGSVQIINHVPLSHYLYGVVKSAMSNSFPTEALKAQAIACKCLAINNFTLSNGIYTISDRASDLIYNGFDKNAKNIIKAVDATMNKALFANSAILDTRFCTSNGGETSLPSAQSEYYAIATDKYDFANPNSRIEKVSFSLGKSIDLPSSLHDTLIERVCAQLGEKADKIEEIYSVTPHSPSVKGASIGMTRCRFLLCVKNSENGTLYDNVACDIAFSALGCFRSPYLEAYWGEISQDSCTLFLARQGGGVGLSMRGAQQRALCGHTYEQILQFYYPGAELKSFTVSAPKNPIKPLPLPTGEYVEAVTAFEVNFRTEPNTDCEIITLLKKGTLVKVYSRNNGWAFAVYNNTAGYLYDAYLSYDPTASQSPEATAAPTPTQTPTPKPTQSASPTISLTGSPTIPPAVSPTPTPDMSNVKFEFAKGITNSEVNFRTKPTTSGSVVIQKLAASTEVNILGFCGDWYYVLYNNRTGFVSSQYVKVTSQGSMGIKEVPPTLTLIATSTTAIVNMRHAPSTNAPLVRKLAMGDKLTVYLMQDGWCLVKQGDEYGYVYADYVRLA